MLRLHNVSRSAAVQDKKTKQTWLVRALLISLIAWFGGLTPGAAQNTGNVASNPAIVYVTNTGGGITEINATNNSVIATAPFRGVGAVAAVTPDGRRMYVTDYLSANVVVLDTKRNVPVAQVSVGSGTGNIGVAVTPDGAAVYVTSQFDGIVSVIDTATNTVVKTIPTGAEPVWMTISPDGSRAYVSNQFTGTVSVIATASNSVIATIGGFAAPSHSRLIHNETELLVSSPGDNTLKVVNTATNTIVKSIPTGATPSGIAVTADGTRAYVADFSGNTVDVIDLNSMTNLGTPISVGINPRGVAIAPGGQLYVANMGDWTVSVIDTATNQASATLKARGGPVAVTVSTTARPVVLRYTFHSIAPGGSPYSAVRALNERGDAVGDFLDANFGFHGFLRTHSGSFQSIDPPGAQATSAFAVNDLGEIVGAYIDSAGSLHGFRRSPSGTYTTVDFPGAPDSQLTGINNLGQSSGVFDLGNRASTRCPGPTCQAISFLLRAGQFTSFEDPAAAPAITFALSINDRGEIAGLFRDLGGNVKGFLRNPTDGSFRTIQFPFADGFSYVDQINDLGVMAGEYSISSVGQGFLTDGTHFLSVDFPNSYASGLRAINSRGEVGGLQIAVPGGPAQAYIASPSAAESAGVVP